MRTLIQGSFIILFLTHTHTNGDPRTQQQQNNNNNNKEIENSSSDWIQWTSLFWPNSKFNESNRRFNTKGVVVKSRERRNNWNDFDDDWDKDIFGDEDNHLEIKSSTIQTTLLPFTFPSQEKHRTIRQTDDEDLLGSGEEGSGDSTSTPKPFSPTDKRFYRISLIINKNWIPSLSSPTSNPFKSYESQFEETLLKSSQYEISTVKVIQFTDIRDPSYIEIRFDVGIEDVTKEEIESEFRAFLNVGAIGDIRIKRDGFSIQDLGSPLDGGCLDSELECRNGRCIRISYRCDGKNDCGDDDGTDEINCPTPATTPITTTTTTTISSIITQPPSSESEREDCRADDQVRCNDGRAIICADQVCDGIPNCPGGEDEDLRMNCSMADSCGRGFFQCDLGKCLPESLKCNGRLDCEDGSDENLIECQSSIGGCGNSEFRCRRSGLCIPVSSICNGIFDCGSNDLSDEDLGCPCAKDYFKCGTGICIPRTSVCDGLFQCSDRSDELNCIPGRGCSGSEFVCISDGSCVPSQSRCNGRSDCRDGSDEVNCPSSSTCRSNEYRCEVGGQCLSISKRCDRREDCPGGDDEKGCGYQPEPSQCNQFQFRCRDSSCIDIILKCDGFKDCPDDSDEDPTNCPGIGNKCGRNEFQCFDRSCISDTLKCDGLPDCYDSSDESPELCRGLKRCENWEYICEEDGKCIEKELVCNGRYDCIRGSDERNCTSCKPGEFQCKRGGCIKWSLRCDYIPDCVDNSDEDPLICYGVCGDDDILCGDGICIKRDEGCNGVCNCRDCRDETENCPNNPNGEGDGSNTRPTPTPSRCGFGEFRCGDGSCISDLLRCDGRPSCPDASDEENCPACLGSFRCSNGRCIDERYKCDGTPQCPSGEDERNCGSTCARDQFTCANGQCIPIIYKCDQVNDCTDGTDETRDTCPDVVTCQSDEFKCIAGGCIPREKVCDRRFDCLDGSDEVSASCPSACRSDEFRCGDDGSCLPISSKCNGRSECRDGSDELNCPQVPSRCGFGQFSCRSGNQCVPSSSVCNSIYDCNDYSDESNCGSPPEGLHLKTYPSDQSIKQAVAGNEVVFQCRDEGQLRASVRWVRGNGIPLPQGSRDFNGRLEIPNIGVEHSGTYICEAVGYPESTPGAKTAVYLRVDPSAGKPLLSRYDFGVSNDTEWEISYFPSQINPKTYTSIIDEPPPTRPPTACALHEATCSNGQCIAKNMICDGDSDCDDGSDEMRCRLDGCEPNEFQCANRKCVLKTWRCDGENDCGDESDEQNCSPPPPGSPCRYNEFQCSTQQTCIMKSFQCDKELDCPDRSDEYGCSPPSVQTPPPSLVTLDIGNMFNISCRVSGIPTPEVVWRLNWGHVPDKCVMSSNNGIGILTCPNIQYGEQGAYSCEAINSLGSTFAQPDCTLVVRNPGTTCSPGKFNEQAQSDSECLPCFCFGVTNECSSVKLYSAQLPPPEANYHLIGVSQDLLSGNIEIQRRKGISSTVLRPSNGGGGGIQAQATNFRSDLSGDTIPFFALPESYTGNQIKSYGGYLKYRLRYRGSSATISGPDVVINGNGITLLHVGKQSWTTGRDHEVSVRYWTGEWFKRVYGRPGGSIEGIEPATREELMMVLSNLQHLLIRAQYDTGSALDTTVSHIRMDSISTSNSGMGQALYVEECRCPPGYTGLSCEGCAPGYERIQGGSWLGRCVPTREKCPEGTYDDLGQCRPCPCPGAGRKYGSSCYRDTDNQITCSCNSGHVGRDCSGCDVGYIQSPNYPFECKPIGVRCDIDGSLSPTPDPLTQRCTCKENTIGPLCNQCKAGTFHLNRINEGGCINCFCSGIVTECSSSNWYRTQERTSFYNSPESFSLVDADQVYPPIRNLTVEIGTRELSYKDFNGNTGVIYYWELPEQYLGDKITAYGGYLNYTIKYIPPPGGQTSPNTGADVEINGNDIRLLYFRRSGTIQPNKQETISVPLIEEYWQRQDGRSANREHLLMALSNLDGLLIKATYTTYSRESYLSDVSFDYAIQTNTGQERAWAVEQCVCPTGYLGLSCQQCSAGYTRSLKGLYLGLCEPCSCNGHSQECDPKTGICKNCRGYTSGDFCDECEVGYSGNPKFGDCVPSSGGSLCRCDPRGSIRNDCPDGRNCICKGNVEGSSCSSCRRGSFNLNETNPQGCLSCYCSLVTTECSESNLYRLPITMKISSEPHGFTLTDTYRTAAIREITFDTRTNELVYSFLTNSPKRERLYWSLPNKFTGKRITSYGGNLKATRRYYVRPGTVSNPTEDIDVILIGKNGISLFNTGSNQRMAGQTLELDVILSERGGWRHSDGSAKLANREDILGVLSDVEAILIRGTFTEDMESTHLKDVSLDDGVRQYTQYGSVSSIEECRCPIGYTGLSCESCSLMYYREGGSCRECPCGDNSEGCQFESGRPVCICKPGYSGVDCRVRGSEIPQPILPTPSPPGPYPPQIEIRISEPRYQISELGSSIMFRCDARSSSGSQLRITWVKEIGSIPVGRGRDDGQGLLVISDIRPEDDGTYVCQATDGYSTASERGRISVVGSGSHTGEGQHESRPEVTITPRYLTTSVGSPAEFVCSATGYPPPVLTWTGGRDGRLGSHVRVNGGIISFPAVRKSDEAEYHCKAENSGGVSSLRTILYVEGEDDNLIEPIQPSEQLRVTINPPTTEARPGETVRIRCESSDSSVRFLWEKPGETLPQSSTQNPNGEFIIYSVTESDSGVYVCNVLKSNGENAQAQTRLQISYAGGGPPESRIEPERQTVAQGSDIELRCIVSGNPLPTIQWTKSGGTFSPNIETRNELLRIPNAQINDRGVYVCNIESGGGKSLSSAIVEVERREAPAIEIFPSPRQTALKDSSALFQCRVSAGIPQPRIIWSRGDGRPMPRNVEELQGGVIRFNRVTEDEKGGYICTAENIVGSISSTGYLDVQIPPRVTLTPSSPHRVRIGERVRLECRGEGEPIPNVSWSKLRPGQQEGDSLPAASDAFRTPQNAIYEISQVRKSDEGIYSCSARNDAGVEEGRLQLIVVDDGVISGNEGPTPQIQPPREQVYYFPIGSRAELRCSQDVRIGVFEELYLDWERSDGGKMPSDYTVIDGRLLIPSVESEDGGRYSCIGTSRDGNIVFSSDAVLQVAGSSPPRIELRPAKQIVRRGDTVYIHCSASGDQPISIEWSRRDRTPLRSTISVNGPDIVFRSIEPSDAGMYACIASNRGGSTEAVAEVIVNTNGGPQIQPPRPSPHGSSSSSMRKEVGISGQRKELSCNVRGPGVVWSKDGSSLPRTAIPLGSSLTLMSLSPSDAGIYSCESREGYEAIELTVEGMDNLAVSVRVTGDKESYLIGDDAELRCEVFGDNNAQVRWHKPSGTRGNNVQINDKILRIKSIMPDNEGVYTCVANTIIGTYDDNYPLNIQGNPNPNPNLTKTVPLGSTVRMDCSADIENAIGYQWTKEGGLIRDESLSEGMTLMIPEVVPDDSGVYICTGVSPTKSVDVQTILRVTGVVPYFNQKPISYMTLPTLSDSYSTFEIQISFKSEDKNGLILYNGQKKDGSGDFFSFGLMGGVPVFKFDLGSGPVTIKGGSTDIGKWSTVRLIRDKGFGSMIVNGYEGPFTGNAKGTFEGLDLIGGLYIGGVPNFGQISRSVGLTKGFNGCIGELIINGKSQILQRDSETSRGVSTCDTCAGINCLNSGICQEGITNRGYKCICIPGYGGIDCEKEVSSCYVGACGSGRCVNGPEGFKCFCPIGKTGIGCEKDIIITQPSFNGNSFLSYPTPKALRKLKMDLRLKSDSVEDGLIMYSSQSNGGDGDYTALSQRDGYLEFQYNTGSGSAYIRSKRSIVVGEWIDVVVERDGQDGSLGIGKEEIVKGKSPSGSRALNLNTPLYVGGIDNRRIQINSGVKVTKGFKGCISNINIEGMELKLIESIIDGGNIEQCESFPLCGSNPCQNGGVCSSNSTSIYYCDCPKPFYGRNCESRDSCSSTPCNNGGTCFNLGETYKCSCAKGWYGRACNLELEFNESVAFRGEGYVELSRDLLPHSDSEEEEIIEIELSTKSDHGLILWHGGELSDPIPGDFISIGLADGKIEFSWDIGGGEGSVLSDKSINDGKKHKVILRRTGGVGEIEIDGGDVDAGEVDGNIVSSELMETPGNIYLGGGGPNTRGLTNGRFVDGFTGCIHNIKFGGSETLNLKKEAINAVNTGPCITESVSESNQIEQDGDGHGHGSQTVIQRKERVEHFQNGTTKTTKIKTTKVEEYIYSEEEEDESFE